MAGKQWQAIEAHGRGALDELFDGRARPAERG